MALTSQQARELAAKRIRPGGRSARSELLEMQQLLLKDIRNPKTEPHIRAQCARAYDVLEERLRIISGRSLPPILREMPLPKERARKAPSVLPLPEVPKESLSQG
jgi:hypothetical protein